MKDIITLREAMVVFNPDFTGPMKFVNGFQRRIGGAELNLAIGCARLGLQTGYITRVGNDEFGKSIRTFARGEGIDTSEVDFINHYPTSINFKEMMEDGSVKTFYYRDKSPTLSMRPEDFNEHYFKHTKVLHLTEIFPAIVEDLLQVMEQAIHLPKKHDVKISFDPNIRLKMWSKEEARKILLEILPEVDILLAGDEEMDIIIGEKDPIAIIEKSKEMGISYIAIKQGSLGSVGYFNGEAVVADPV